MPMSTWTSIPTPQVTAAHARMDHSATMTTMIPISVVSVNHANHSERRRTARELASLEIKVPKPAKMYASKMKKKENNKKKNLLMKKRL
jgi:hypothetical protein